MAIMGGLRDRLITDNLINLIGSNLDNLGWFSDNNLAEYDIHIQTSVPFDNEEIQPNVIAISPEDNTSSEAEMGSNLSESVTVFAIDVYAENDAVGRHLAGDIKAILEGRFPSINRTDSNMEVMNLTVNIPYRLFTVDFQHIASSKQRMYTKPFEKYWWTIMFEVVDVYGDEDDD